MRLRKSFVGGKNRRRGSGKRAMKKTMSSAHHGSSAKGTYGRTSKSSLFVALMVVLVATTIVYCEEASLMRTQLSGSKDGGTQTTGPDAVEGDGGDDSKGEEEEKGERKNNFSQVSCTSVFLFQNVVSIKVSPSGS